MGRTDPRQRSDRAWSPTAIRTRPLNQGTLIWVGRGRRISFLTLQDAIQAAIRCNPDLRAAEQRTQIADAILARARSEFYPRLGISEDYAVTNNAAQAFMYLLEQGRFSPNLNFNNPGVVDDFHTQLLVQQGVYAGGRRLAETEAAAANHQATCFGLWQPFRTNSSFASQRHITESFRPANLRQYANIPWGKIEQHLEIVRARERAETAVKSDVLTVQVRLAEANEALITARHQHDLAWAVLENVCGTRIEQRVFAAGSACRALVGACPAGRSGSGRGPIPAAGGEDR